MTLAILLLTLSVGLIFGYVYGDFRRWSKEYDAYQYAMARRRVMVALDDEPENGPWDNGRVA